jgi:hypothetical protein
MCRVEEGLTQIMDWACQAADFALRYFSGLLELRPQISPVRFAEVHHKLPAPFQEALAAFL